MKTPQNQQQDIIPPSSSNPAPLSDVPVVDQQQESELRDAVAYLMLKYANDLYDPSVKEEPSVDDMLDLITRYSEQRELEARIDEVGRFKEPIMQEAPLAYQMNRLVDLESQRDNAA